MDVVSGKQRKCVNCGFLVFALLLVLGLLLVFGLLGVVACFLPILRLRAGIMAAFSDDTVSVRMCVITRLKALSMPPAEMVLGGAKVPRGRCGRREGPASFVEDSEVEFRTRALKLSRPFGSEPRPQ